MGDYVYASIDIHGPINSVEALEELIEALLEKHLKPGLNEWAQEATAPHLRAAFAGALSSGSFPTFSDGEVNYGDLSTVTDVCLAYGISYSRTAEAAGDSGPQECCWYPGEKNEFTADDALRDARQLEDLLAYPDLRHALEADIALLRRAAGADLPKKLVVSDEVRDHLAVEVARALVTA